ncbi:type I-C CRISPR-associated protein Cas7/Csd2 [Campylobacterota bacterium]|nr:type I-C CRISPR-associated protein Cas7/Csd2 [Campylobacterota bacterium]
MDNEIKRITGLLVIEVVNSNPNGDPDRESDPRQRPNGLGEISPVSFKRKLRDILEDADEASIKTICESAKISPANFPLDELRILEARGRDRGVIQKEMGKDLSKFDQTDFLKSEFVKKYWDARVFGNTFLEKEAAKGYIKTGAVQFGVGLSISPVSIVRWTNTNKSGVQEGKNQGMAPLAFRIVEHGVYVMPFFVNPNLAAKTGCAQRDIDLLKALIPHAYVLNPSTIRTQVYLRHAWWIEHKSILGSCQDYLLFEALTPKRIGNAQEPSTSWKDYEDVAGLSPNLKEKIADCQDLMAQ